jgi:hypothetical protein
VKPPFVNVEENIERVAPILSDFGSRRSRRFIAGPQTGIEAA